MNWNFKKNNRKEKNTYQKNNNKVESQVNLLLNDEIKIKK
jgi:hypothetical protein